MKIKVLVASMGNLKVGQILDAVANKDKTVCHVYDDQDFCWALYHNQFEVIEESKEQPITQEPESDIKSIINWIENHVKSVEFK